jgi:AraC family transcriptional regulator, transcriptional activator of pobA
METASFAGFVNTLETHALPDSMGENFEFFEIDADKALYLRQQVIQPHRHDYQEIIWIREGGADHLLDGLSAGVPAGSLLVIPKGRMHRFSPLLNMTGCVLRFNDEFLPNSSQLLFSQFVGLIDIPLTGDDSAAIERYFALIGVESQQPDCRQGATLRHLLRAFLAKIEQLRLRLITAPLQALSQSQRLWERFNTLLEDNFKSRHAASYYSGELGCSPRKLNVVVRLFTGLTTAEAIDKRLILEAKRLILFSGMTIKEVAYDLGFEEHSYFTKVFKKLTGFTPSAFKDSGA